MLVNSNELHSIYAPKKNKTTGHTNTGCDIRKDIIQTTDSYIFLTVPGSRMKR